MSGNCPEDQGWRLQVTLSRAVFEALEAALEEHVDAVVAETIEASHPIREAPADLLRVTLFGAASAGDDPRLNRLRAVLSAAGVESDETTIEPVRSAHWETESLASFPPVSVGRLTIAGAHRAAPRRRFALARRCRTRLRFRPPRIDPGLPARARLAGPSAADDAVRWMSARAPASSRWRRRGSGRRGCSPFDSDPVAVATARETVRRNGLSRRVSVVRGEGFRAATAGRVGRADLIVANIRARPIAAMAPDFARHLRPGGAAALSGLLADEERLVLAAFRARGLRLRRRIRLGAWVTLILTR